MRDDFGTIDLLRDTAMAPKYVPSFLRPASHWKRVSGKWERKPAGVIRYLHDPSVVGGENSSLIGSRRWEDFTLSVTFRMLSGSTRPPEGGVILYFLYRSAGNFYSCHFCQWKQKIEFVKRIRGKWSSTAEGSIHLDLHTDYNASLTTASGVHTCRVDGAEVLRVEDSAIVRGCVGLGVKYCNAEFSSVSISFPSIGSITA